MPWKQDLNHQQHELLQRPLAHSQDAYERLQQVLEIALRFAATRAYPDHKAQIHAAWHQTTRPDQPLYPLVLEARRYAAAAIAAIDQRTGHHAVDWYSV